MLSKTRPVRQYFIQIDEVNPSRLHVGRDYFPADERDLMPSFDQPSPYGQHGKNSTLDGYAEHGEMTHECPL